MMSRKQRHDSAADVSMWPRQYDGNWQKLGSAAFPEVGKVPQGVCRGGHGSRNGLAASSGGCACLAGGSGDGWPSPQMMALWQRGDFRDFRNQAAGKVPLALGRGAGSRGGLAS